MAYVLDAGQRVPVRLVCSFRRSVNMGSNREQQLVDKIRQLLPDSKKKYTWTDIEKVDELRHR